jgi:hypothetical protein
LHLVADKAKLEIIENKIKEIATISRSNTQSKNIKSNKSLYQPDSRNINSNSSSDSFPASKISNEAEVRTKIVKGHAQVAKSKYDKYKFLADQRTMSAYSVQKWRITGKCKGAS